MIPAERAQYVLPLRWANDTGLAELTEYLGILSRWIGVTVVDASPEPMFSRHAEHWRGLVRHAKPSRTALNGKVAGVLTGVELARAEIVVIADDDVRYNRFALENIVAAAAEYDVVRPQNYFDPLPWHARWDTGRSLVNRGLGSDFPGTLAVRRSTLLEAGGYDGDVLFENLELIRTVRAAGGRELRADALFVARRPPSLRQFLGQRVRQAYDSFAQPVRLVAELSLLPLAVWASRRPTRLAVGVALVLLVAERGRRRGLGRTYYRRWASLWAPFWVAERAVTSWVAVGARMRGGVRYRGIRLARAATPERVLRTRAREAA